MTAPQGFIHGRPGPMTDLAGQLDPQPVRDGRTAAGNLGASAVGCETTLPGCVRFNQQVRAVAERFGAFFAEADEGLRAFTSVGQVSAADYAGQDADTSATFAAMNRPTMASPLTGTRPAL
jgi:hypothetical protein